jgi:hypothetical protein
MRTLKNKKNFQDFRIEKLMILTIKKNPQDPTSSEHKTVIGPFQKKDYKLALIDFATNKKTKIWSMPGKALLLTNGKTGYFLIDQTSVISKKKLSAKIKKLVKK